MIVILQKTEISLHCDTCDRFQQLTVYRKEEAWKQFLANGWAYNRHNAMAMCQVCQRKKLEQHTNDTIQQPNTNDNNL